MKMDYVDATRWNHITTFDDPNRISFKKIYSEINGETSFLLTQSEAYQIFMAVSNLGKIEGDIAKVGVYCGGSAKIISRAKGDKTLFLFDTFEGIPEITDIDSFTVGQYASDYESVKRYLMGENKIVIYKGLFPESAYPIQDRRFSFVHLDVDTYSSTISGLMFFYPRLVPGGVIISHDYLNIKGVRAAFEEYFKNMAVAVFETSGTQCMVIKVRAL